jgi:CHAT domain-containing protein
MDLPMLLRQAKAQYDGGQFQRAVVSLQQVADYYEQRGDRLHQAQALSLKSLGLQQLGQWQGAEQAIDQSFVLLQATIQTNGAPTAPWQRIRAQVLNTQGQLQFALGQPDIALTTWQRAEADYHQAQDPLGQLGSQINQAKALQSLGFYRRAQHHYQEIAKTLKQQPTSPLKVMGLLNFAEVLQLNGQVERAYDLATEGLALSRQLSQQLSQQLSSSGEDSPRSMSDQQQALALLALANLDRLLSHRAQRLGYLPEAQHHFTLALNRYQEASQRAINPLTQLQAQLNQLSFLLEISPSEHLAQAQALWPPMLVQLERLPPSRDQVYLRTRLAQRLLQLEQLISQSIAQPIAQPIAQQLTLPSLRPETFPILQTLLSQALTQAQQLDDPKAQAVVLGNLGHLQEVAGHPDLAQTLTRQALNLAQAIPAPELVYQWQWQMGRLLKPEQRKPDQRQRAIDYYQAAVATLGQLRYDLVTLDPDVQFSFREQVEPIYRQLVALLLDPADGSVPAPILTPIPTPIPTQRDLHQAQQVLEALQLAELDNFFRDACAQPRSVEISQIDGNTGAIYSILLPDRLVSLVKLPNSDFLHFYQQNISATEVGQTIGQLQRSLRRRSTPPSRTKALGQKLYHWLLGPILSDWQHQISSHTPLAQTLATLQTLVFVPDGPLRNIPLATLYDGEQYLIERYSLANAPGLELIDPKPLQRQTLHALIGGAMDAPSFRQEGLGPLQYVETELDQVHTTFNRAKTLSNQTFLQENLRRQLRQSPINVVHLATHGNFSSDLEQTFLLDWQGRIGVKDIDRLLQPIPDLSPKSESNHPVELLVLSACETATGDDRAALGLTGMAIRAGARSTIGTLWQVNDASTAEFMTQFYRYLADPNLTKAEALRQTQLAFLHNYPNLDYSRPYHWAPFILVGNWL